MKLIENIRVPFPLSYIDKFSDPVRIENATEANYFKLIYATLLTHSNEGEIIPYLAKSFKWTEGSLLIELHKEYKTISGHKISSNDVILSLKRMIILNKSTHSNLKKILCPTAIITKTEDSCPGLDIDKKGNILITPISKNFKNTLLEALASIEAMIIPSISIDNESLSIKNQIDTTGPYFVKETLKEKIILEKNVTTIRSYSKRIKNLTLIEKKTLKDGYIKSLLSNKIDIIPTYQAGFPTKYIEQFKESTVYNIHTTLNIKLYQLRFTPKGLDQFSSKRRFIIGNKIKQLIIEEIGDKEGFKESVQFFNNYADGRLTGEKEKEINKLNQISKDELEQEKGEGLIFAAGDSDYDYFLKRLGTILPKAKILKADPLKFLYNQTNSNYKDLPHLVPESTDSAFKENSILLSYILSQDIGILNKKEKESILDNFNNELDTRKRITILENLHYNLLKSAAYFPMFSMPYVIVTKKPLIIMASKLFAGTPLWKIQNQK